MIKAIVFDWGGCVTRGSMADVICRELAKRLHISLERVKEAYDLKNKDYLLGKVTEKQFWRSFSNHLNITDNEPYFENIFEHEPLVKKGMLELIKQLKGNYPLGLLSDNYAGYVQYIKKKYKLKKYFDVMVFSNEVGIKKPNPKIFRLLARRLRVKPYEIFYMDDYPKNVRAAKHAGLTTVHFTSIAKLKKDMKHRGISY